MLARLLPIIKDIVGRLWDQRFQGSLIEAKNHGDPESYRKGYSAGYWDGIEDMARILAEQEKADEERKAALVAHSLLREQPAAEA